MTGALAPVDHEIWGASAPSTPAELASRLGLAARAQPRRQSLAEPTSEPFRSNRCRATKMITTGAVISNACAAV